MKIASKSHEIFLWIAFFAGILSVAANGEENGRGPVLWYHFDEGFGSVTVDSSGNGNNGRMTEGVGWGEGKFGAGLDFDGKGGFVICPDSKTLHLNKTASMMAWVKPRAVGATMNIIHAGTCQNRIIMNGGTLQGSFFVGDAYCKSEGRGIEAGIWSHVAVTYDGNKTVLYINGESVGEKISNAEKLNFFGPIYISGEKGMAFFFNGMIDEVKVFGCALNAEEIRKDFGGIPSMGGSREKLAALKQNVDEQAARLENELERRDGGDFRAFFAIHRDFVKLADDIEREFSGHDSKTSGGGDATDASFVLCKKKWDELNDRSMQARDELVQKIEGKKAGFQQKAGKIKERLGILKKENMDCRAVQTDLDKAQIYFNLGDIKAFRGLKRLDYLKSGFECLEAAFDKIDKITKGRIGDSMRGARDELLVGVTYTPRGENLAFDVLKAMKIDFCGNSLGY
ncbi:MAG: LamG domain-containing protein, partial [Verrucomicrobiae bacterium]|nr:LamG domain-containing protein [Verrucomicrobiae bacterium]